MALIKLIAEAKEVLPKLLSSLDDDSFLPNVNTAEEKYVVPLIGDALYSDLQAKYDQGVLTAEEQTLVKHIALVTLAYGFLDELIASHVVLTGNGVRTMDTANMPKAVGWEYKELKKYLQDRALDGTEVLLKYLWKKREELPLWTESEAYRQFEGLLIRTGTDFSLQYQLYQPMRTFYSLKSLMHNVQDWYLETGIGKELLQYFLVIVDPVPEEEAILKQLEKALAYFTIKHAGDHFTVRFSEGGFTVINEIMGGDRESEDSGRSNASAGLLKEKLRACDRDGKNFMARAKKLLVAHRRSGGAGAGFDAAFDAGPLAGYVDPRERTLGNERRKIFRF